jgi:predicted helicase
LPAVRLGPIFGSAPKSFQRKLKKALCLSASHNSICKPRRNIKPNFGTFGHSVRCRAPCLHISSKKTAGERSDLLREFVGHKRALMTNARCLTEGVDVPAIDCVMFADPKQSRIDIVQAAGRALRRFRGKECGYVVVPLIVPAKMDFEEFAQTTAFRQVAQTITALSTQDERIADEFRAIEKGRVSSGKIVEIEGDILSGLK